MGDWIACLVIRDGRPVSVGIGEKVMDQEKQKREEKPSVMGQWIAIGMGVGVALGVVMDNIALGVAMGLAMGTALGAAFDGQNQQDE